TIRLQPCFSPVWDTALTLVALADAGDSAGQGAVGRGVEWLLEKEVRRPGDWSVMNPHLEPAGWFFEYRNGFYPDTDDTAMVLMGLARAGHGWENSAPTDAAVTLPRPAVRRGIDWLLAMQNTNGGWA